MEIFLCEQCDRSFQEKEQLAEHVQSHEQESEFRCCKCDKVYNDMSKLRRHDWRNHRNIACTICNERIESRQEISSHWRIVHKMYRSIQCKFFPECYDENEFLFEHTNAQERRPLVCPNGQTCADQSCSFSERNHRSSNHIMCRYQEKCNRSACQFQYNATKKHFLGVGPIQSKRI